MSLLDPIAVRPLFETCSMVDPQGQATGARRLYPELDDVAARDTKAAAGRHLEDPVREPRDPARPDREVGRSVRARGRRREGRDVEIGVLLEEAHRSVLLGVAVAGRASVIVARGGARR